MGMEYLEMSGNCGRAAPNSNYLACQLVIAEERSEKGVQIGMLTAQHRPFQMSSGRAAASEGKCGLQKVVASLPQLSHSRLSRPVVWHWASQSFNDFVVIIMLSKIGQQQVIDVDTHEHCSKYTRSGWGRPGIYPWLAVVYT